MYRAPLKDIQFVLHDLIGDAALRSCPRYAEYSPDLADTILQEAGKFAENVLDPLYKTGDREGARWTSEGVLTAPGFKEAYAKFTADGWASLRGATEFGGQGMPILLGTAVEELWAGANLGFKLCPMLTQGATEAIEFKGSQAQKHLYLPRMISGEWSGTMNLTEPQAGSDLAAVRTRAVRDGEHYRLYGQKIFITYGDHDFTRNIIHLVLARVDGAPPGVKGISLFIVPKVLVRADGSLGARNDVHCISIEHKLGIHASPTCVLAFGQRDGAVGYLIGEENRGLEYMFIMMNAARLSVGLEGYAVAERSFQQAREWARSRVQGKPPVAAASGPLPIAHHPDVKRMLLLMKSQVEAMRALAIYAAFNLDLARAHPDAATRARHQARGDLLIPIVKGFCTETGIEIASLGVQVHGGMGFIEETGAAQAYRDVRITTIYEGTTGIQSNDLVGRKVGRDQGAAYAALLDDMERELEGVIGAGAELAAVETLRGATETIVQYMSTTPDRALALSVPFLKLGGIVIGAWLMARSADIAQRKLSDGDSDSEFLQGKLVSAAFYREHVLPQATALGNIVRTGAAAVVDVDAGLI
jgi:acyl-CoA dehydrogenase